MEIRLYTFSKRRNSTARPTNAASTFQIVLKDTSGVLRPVVEFAVSATWNPSAFNYAYIPNFQRYYYIDEWSYVGGRWEATLSVDAMASWKTEIGAEIKYVLRSSAAHNINAVDTFYPTVTGNMTHYSTRGAFDFDRNLSGGTYVIGIANAESSANGAITYYVMSSSEMRSFLQYLFYGTADPWTADPVTTGWENIVRSVYGAFDYIKSCMWFPFNVRSLNTVNIKFGIYTSNVVAALLPTNLDNWPTYGLNLALPSNWSTMDAKYRTAPNAKLYVRMAPFGVIELNPSEIGPEYTQINVSIAPDLITGECAAVISKVSGSDAVFLTQAIAKMGVEMNLSSASVDASGAISGILGTVGAVVGGIASGGGLFPVALAAAGSLAGAMESTTPSASASVGKTMNGARYLSGRVDLFYNCPNFANENNSEFGKPLLSAVQLSTIPGYIKCADGEISIAGMPDELTEISEHLTNGFFYE